MSLQRVQPIIPTWRKEPFDDPEWLFDFKCDGFRAVCYLERRRCRLVSRNGNLLGRFDELGNQLAGEGRSPGRKRVPLTMPCRENSAFPIKGRYCPGLPTISLCPDRELPALGILGEVA
jgi:hypothetical protein